MIYLKKGQTLFDNPGMVVYDPTGYYDDGTSVICAPIFAPEEPACRYEAKHIAYGGMVYSISDQEELLKQILEIDPNTLFGKDSKQIAIDKAVDGIVVQETSTPISDESLNQKTEEEPEEKIQQEDTPTTAPPSDVLSSDTSTTTNPVTETSQIPETSPTTPVDLPLNTTSPEEILPVENIPTENPVVPVDIPATTPIEDLLPTESIPPEVIGDSTLIE